jgi:hypothetical protein
MPVIGPDLPTESGQMAFVPWTKDPFSTSESLKIKIERLDYCPGNKLIKFLAPASIHNFASFFIFSNITMDGACLLLKTRAFLSFQTSKVTSKVSKETAL